MTDAKEIDRLLGPGERHAGRLDFSGRQIVVVDLIKISNGWVAVGDFPVVMAPRGYTTCTLYGQAGVLRVEASYTMTAQGECQLTFGGQVEITQRRQHFRIPVSVPVTLQMPLRSHADPEEFQGHLADISMMGCLVVLSTPLPPGALFQLKLPASYESLVLTIEVSSCRHQGENRYYAGCRFVRLTATLQRQVLDIVLREMARYKENGQPEQATVPSLLHSNIDQVRLAMAQLGNLLNGTTPPDPQEALLLVGQAINKLSVVASLLTAALPHERKEYSS